MFTAESFFITAGVGIDKKDIASFDKAIIAAGLGNYNLVRVSSIIPPNSKASNIVSYPAGSIIYTAYAKNFTCQNEIISSAIAAAIPLSHKEVGVIMEYSCLGDKEAAIDVAKRLAIEAMIRRGVNDYKVIAKGVQAKGKVGYVTTTFAAIALL